MIKEFGGNKVCKLNLSEISQYDFPSSAYVYRYARLQSGQELSVKDLSSFTIFVLEAPAKGAFFTSKGNQQKTYLDQFDAVQIEDSTATIGTESGDLVFLVSGVKTKHAPKSVTVKKLDQIKKVQKPWGHELWISGEHPGYCLKQIFIRAPYKTSLQYHNFKCETNVLFSGSAKLHYKNDPTVENEFVGPEHIGTEDLEPISIVAVNPPTIHRIEAVTDILLYETSTPHLDDVIRLADDSKRPDGRIEAEHRTV